MEKLFLSLALIFSLSTVSAQKSNINYDQKWKEFEEYEKKDLPKSALKIVEEIYNSSKKEKNNAHFIKAFIKKYELEAEVFDKSINEHLTKYEKEVETLWQPAKQLAHNYISKVYISYINDNRYRLLSNGEVKTQSSDITKLSLTNLREKAEYHTLTSLTNPAILKREKTENYAVLLSAKSSKTKYRPTLYDMLVADAFEALSSDDIANFPQENDSLMNNKSLLGDLDDFLKIEISQTQQKFSNSKSIIIFKEWIKHLQYVNDQEMLIDADLYRLLWSKNKYLGDDKIILLEKSLKNLTAKAKGLEIESRLIYEQGNLYYSISYEKGDEINTLVKAWELANQAINTNPKSEGAELAKVLIKNIESPQVYIENESSILPDQPFVFNITSKNVKELYLYLYELEKPILDKKYDQISNEKIVENSKSIKNQVIKLPQFNDFINHSTELAFDMPKRNGEYLLFITTEPFKGKIEKHNIYQLITFQKTNISYLTRNHISNSQLVTTINSTTGRPIENAEITTFYNNYRNKQNEIISKATSNKQGECVLNENKSFGYFNMMIEKDEDVFVSSTYSRYNNSKPQNRPRHFILTDRNIYRPGQTVYYKIIAMTSDGETSNVIENEVIKISLRDFSGKEVSTNKFKTNQYGSVSGSFVIPNEVLTGNFSIRTDFGYKQINIEEYKRPKMEVTFKPFDEIKQVGDSVSVVAIAKGYAGYAIQGATVNWKIEQSFGFWRYYFPYKTTTLANGNSVTNDKGEVEINFKSIVQKGVPENIPYYYAITVDVTSPSGETITSTKTITLSNRAFKANAKINETTILSDNKKVTLTISLENMSGEKVNEQIYYTINELVVPNIPQTYRFWSEPDTIISKSNFESNKLNKNSYKIKQHIISEIKNVNKEESISINISKTGVYRIDVYKSADKKELLDTQFFSVINEAVGKYELDEALTIFSNNRITEIGNNIQIYVGSGFDDAYVYLNISHNGKTLKDENFSLTKEWKMIDFTIPKEVNGIIDIQAIIIRNNRIYERSINITVEEKSNILNLKLSSFRDNTTPGSIEKWEITFQNANDNPVNGEVLALLYDSSLDKFAKNYLSANPFNSYKPDNKWSAKGSSQNGSYGVNHLYIEPYNADDYPTFFWRYFRNYYGPKMSGQIFYMSKRTAGLSMSPGLSIISDEVEIMDYESNVMNDAGDTQNKAVANEEEVLEKSDLEIRTEFQETAFFYPFLETDINGKANLSFTMPESLTKWRFMALAHRKDGHSASTEEYITVSKQLMVVPNLPRVVRHGDVLSFNTSIINNSNDDLEGIAKIVIKDLKLGNIINTKPISWKTNSNKGENVKWEITVPNNFTLLEVTITANSDKYSDGETHLIPVLSSKVYLTETLPIFLYEKGKHNFELEKLTKGGKKEYENLTFTYTENSAWEVLSVLPWISERPYENSDQIFNRIYSASVAKQILKEHPNIKETLNLWSKLPQNSDALKSALEKNPELKSTLLSITPWVNSAENETEIKIRLANFTNETNLNNEIETSLKKLKERQLASGAWPWFNCNFESPSTTIDIIVGFGQLRKLGVELDKESKLIETKAINWLINCLKEEEKKIIERKKDLEVRPSYQIIKAIYALSFFDKVDNQVFWLERIAKDIPTNNIQLQSMVATIMLRTNNKLAYEILQSLQENLITQDKNIYYYKTERTPYWYSSPIETHVSAIEAFREADKYQIESEKIRNWLISQKRTQSWNSTRATTNAVYIFATSKQNYFAKNSSDIIEIGGKTIDKDNEIDGLGYISKSWNSNDIKPKMGKIAIDKKSDTPSWASMHLSYFEEESAVEEGGFLQVKCTFYKRVIENGKEVWEKIDNTTILKKGDKILTRIEIETPQTLDFVHVDSPRASALEPTNTISGYRWQNNFSYYESTKDSGTDFFITQLPKGENRLEYESTVVMEGKVTNGPTKVSCFYAPEFAGHSNSQIFRIK